jgi:hypothetical protein
VALITTPVLTLNFFVVKPDLPYVFSSSVAADVVKHPLTSLELNPLAMAMIKTDGLVLTSPASMVP